MSNMMKNLILWIAIAAVLMSVFNNFAPVAQPPTSLAYSEFISNIKSGQIRAVNIDPDQRTITGTLIDGREFTTTALQDPKLMDDLLANNVAVTGTPREKPSLFMELLIHWFPLLLLIGVWIFFMRQMQGGGQGTRRAVVRQEPGAAHVRGREQGHVQGRRRH